MKSQNLLSVQCACVLAPSSFRSSSGSNTHGCLSSAHNGHVHPIDKRPSRWPCTNSTGTRDRRCCPTLFLKLPEVYKWRLAGLVDAQHKATPFQDWWWLGLPLSWCSSVSVTVFNSLNLSGSWFCHILTLYVNRMHALSYIVSETNGILSSAILQVKPLRNVI